MTIFGNDPQHRDLVRPLTLSDCVRTIGLSEAELRDLTRRGRQRMVGAVPMPRRPWTPFVLSRRKRTLSYGGILNFGHEVSSRGCAKAMAEGCEGE